MAKTANKTASQKDGENRLNTTKSPGQSRNNRRNTNNQNRPNKPNIAEVAQHNPLHHKNPKITQKHK